MIVPARLLVLSGPSGVGKSSVVDRIRSGFPEVHMSVSVTTRAPRPGEVDGVHYLFIGRDAFDRMIADGELLEWAEFAGNLYGTPAAPVAQSLAEGRPVLVEIDLQGARQVRARAAELGVDDLLVFLAPPSWDVLVQRLEGRGTEDPDVIAARLETARVELAAEGEFDRTVVNDDIAQAAEEIVALLNG